MPRQFNLKLSDIFADIAQVSLAVLVLPFFIGQNLEETAAAIGIIVSLVFWAISLKLTWNKYE